MKNLLNKLILLISMVILYGQTSFAQEYDDMYFSANDRMKVKYADAESKPLNQYQDYSGNSSKYSDNYDGTARDVDSDLVKYYKDKAEETSNSYAMDNGTQNLAGNDGYYSDESYDYVSSDNTNRSGTVNNYYGPTYLSDPWYTNPGYAVYTGYNWGYYPWRPVNWGLGFGWNSWSGWNVGFGWGWNSWGLYDPFWGPSWSWNNWGWRNRYNGWGGGCWNCYPGCGPYGGGAVVINNNVGLNNSSYYGPRYANRST
ncbi:MAG: hypothetical protein RIM68_05465, partial [Arenibacter sp.]